MDLWEAVIVDEEVFKEFLERYNLDTLIILRPSGNSQVASSWIKWLLRVMHVIFIQIFGSGHKSS